MYRIWLVVQHTRGATEITPYFVFEDAGKHYNEILTSKKRIYEIRFNPELDPEVRLVRDGGLDSLR